MTLDWDLLDKVIQWLVIPALAVAYNLYQRVNSQEKDILRILTILEERERRRTEDREVEISTAKALKDSIEKLSAKIDDTLSRG